ncbi:MAG TPA: hypothetical protein VKP59_03145 [Candidatus Thermoplasmatota archaeon]|nr:hypothetical protein [Candidatus Thermoplasmatota archaeon]
MEQKRNAQCALTSVIENELDILKRHIHVLTVLKEHQPMGIIKLSELTGYPQHMVRYSLRILEQEKLIEPSSRGAVVTENFKPTLNALVKALKHINISTEDILRNIQ